MLSRLLLPALLLASPLPPATAEEAPPASVRLVAFGDTGAGPAAQRNVDAAIAEGAIGFVGLGDYDYDRAPSAWRAMFAPLLAGGAYLAIGNHDDLATYADLFPDGPVWSRSVNGVQLVAADGRRNLTVGTPGHDGLRRLLCDAPEPTKILLAHHNWWLDPGAVHPGTEWRASPADMDRLVQECGVDLVLAGHEHNYQRSVRGGVPHVIAGTGGRSLYAIAGTPAGTSVVCECFGRLLLDLSPTGFRAEFRDLAGNVRDAFATGEAGPSFVPRNGNAWWVQVRAPAGAAGVEARVAEGDWSPLAPRAWGDWAAGVRVPPDARVQYRASMPGNATFESCWHAHPAGGCGGAPPSVPAPPAAPAEPPSTLVVPRGGNEWWVQARVTPQPLLVEARDTGGAFVPLALKAWGDWAGSFRVEAGHHVLFRLTTAANVTIESCWFLHPTAACAPEETPPPAPSAPPPFSATFSRARGNAWWVEVDVATIGASPAGVEARVEGGPWMTLAPTRWGSFAREMHATGVVEFRALSADGAEAVSAPYAWPPG